MNKLITLDNLTKFHEGLQSEFGSAQFTYIIDSQDKFDAFANQTTGNDYSYIAIIGGKGSGTNGEYELNSTINCQNTKEIIGFRGATINIDVTNINENHVIYNNNKSIIKNITINITGYLVAPDKDSNFDELHGIVSGFSLENCNLYNKVKSCYATLGSHYICINNDIIDKITGETVASLLDSSFFVKKEFNNVYVFYFYFNFNTSPDEDLDITFERLAYINGSTYNYLSGDQLKFHINANETQAMEAVCFTTSRYDATYTAGNVSLSSNSKASYIPFKVNGYNANKVEYCNLDNVGIKNTSYVNNNNLYFHDAIYAYSTITNNHIFALLNNGSNGSVENNFIKINSNFYSSYADIYIASDNKNFKNNNIYRADAYHVKLNTNYVGNSTNCSATYDDTINGGNNYDDTSSS